MKYFLYGIVTIGTYCIFPVELHNSKDKIHSYKIMPQNKSYIHVRKYSLHGMFETIGLIFQLHECNSSREPSCALGDYISCLLLFILCRFTEHMHAFHRENTVLDPGGGGAVTMAAAGQVTEAALNNLIGQG